jgi:hypothetical protein
VECRMHFQHDSLEGLVTITIAGLKQLGITGVRWEYILTLKESKDNSQYIILLYIVYSQTRLRVQIESKIIQ